MKTITASEALEAARDGAQRLTAMAVGFNEQHPEVDADGKPFIIHISAMRKAFEQDMLSLISSRFVIIPDARE